MKTKNFFKFKTSRDVEKILDKIPNSITESHLDMIDFVNNLFIGKDGSLGVLYRLDGIYDEPLVKDQLDAYFAELYHIFRQILPGIPGHLSPGNIVIQVICCQRKQNEPPLNNYNYNDNFFTKLLRDEENELYKSGYFLKRDIYLSIRYFPNYSGFYERNPLKVIKGFFNKKGESTLSMNQFIKQTTDDFNELLFNLENKKYFLHRLDEVEYTRVCQNILNAGDDRYIIPKADKIYENIYTYPISDQSDHLELAGKKIKSYYLKETPSRFKIGRLREFIDELRDYDCDIVVTLSHGSIHTNKIELRGAWFENKKPKIFKNFKTFIDNVNPEEPYSIQSFRLIIHNPLRSTSSELDGLSGKWLGTRLWEESQLLLHSLVTSLPLNCRPEQNKLKGRSLEIRLYHTMKFLPVYSGPSQKGVVTRPSRSLLPASADLLAGSGNKMACIIGLSGVGKSVYTHLTIIEFFSRYFDGIVRIIDIKTSYLKLVQLTKGKIVSFSAKVLEENPYSPFAIPDWDENDLEHLLNLILTVIAQRNMSAKIESIHSDILKVALKEAYQNYEVDKKKFSENAKHPTWTSIKSCIAIGVQRLIEKDVPEADAEKAQSDLIKWTLDLNKEGSYGFIFDEQEKKDSLTSEAKFLVYDLDGIKDETLNQIAAMMASMKVMRDLKKLPEKTKKLIIFEELGMLLKGNDLAQKKIEIFLTDIAKTSRKLGAQGIFISNNIGDFHIKRGGKAVWDQSPQKVFLPLYDLFETAQEAWRNSYNEAEWEILESLKLEEYERRSSVYISSKNNRAPFKGSFYLPLSKVMNAITTTTSEETSKYNELIKSGKTPEEALDIMIEQFPYGENL